MSKYDEAKKGARFTMCQAALQGGADVSIVPKVMDYIETGNAEALRYVSPCEVMEKEVKDTSAKYEELRGKRDELQLAHNKLKDEFEKQKIQYDALLGEARKFQREMESEQSKLHDIVPNDSAMTRSSVITCLSGINTSHSTRVFVQVGEYLMAVSDVKLEHGKPIIKVGGSNFSNPNSIYRILPEGALEGYRCFDKKFDEIHDQLGKYMKGLSEIVGDDVAWIHNIVSYKNR
jgi:hypothetical protein